MSDSTFPILGNSWNCSPWPEPEEKPIDTLTAFIRDAEHELLSVITALQAHVDLLRFEQTRSHQNVDRFSVLDRSIARLITDTNVLLSVSDLAKAPRSNEKHILQELMREIASETQAAFSIRQVSLSCDIASGTTLIGKSGPLKLMITGILLTILHKCHNLETIRIIGVTDNRRVSLSFGTGLETGAHVFNPWRLGELRLIPLNGDGISIAAVDAIARLHRGHLRVSTLADQRHGYMLNFNV